MHIIAHRRNTLDEIRNTPTAYGVEVDIRSRGSELIIQHDPFVDGTIFLDWISEYRHGTLILNVKEEGLESRLIELMHHHKIDDFFFLDQSFPFLIKWAKAGERRCAVRVSEFESIQTALSLAGMVTWIWVDCFTRFPLAKKDAATLRDAGFKLCLVSPELQGRNAEKEVPMLKETLLVEDIRADAVCTKRPDLWQEKGVEAS